MMFICNNRKIAHIFVELEKQIEQKKIAKDMELRKELEREERENQRILKEQQMLKEREEREILSERMNRQASLNSIEPSHSKPNSAAASSSQATTPSLTLSAVRKPKTPNYYDIPIVSEPLFTILEGTDRSSSLSSTFDRSSPMAVGQRYTPEAAIHGGKEGTTGDRQGTSTKSSRRDSKNDLFEKLDNNDNEYLNISRNSDNNNALIPKQLLSIISKQNNYSPRMDHHQQHHQQDDGSKMNKGNKNLLFDKNDDVGYDVGYDDGMLSNNSGYSNKLSIPVMNRNRDVNIKYDDNRNQLFDQNDDDHHQRSQHGARNNGSDNSRGFDSASVFRSVDVMQTMPPISREAKKQLNRNILQNDQHEIDAYRDSSSHNANHEVSHHSNDDERRKLDNRVNTGIHTTMQQQEHVLSAGASNQNYRRDPSVFSIDQSEQRIIVSPLSPAKKKVEQQLLSKLNSNLSSIDSARRRCATIENKGQPSIQYAAATTATAVDNHQPLVHNSNLSAANNRGNNYHSNTDKYSNVSLNRTLEFESKFLLPDGTVIDNNSHKSKSSFAGERDDILDQLIIASDRGDKGNDSADASYASYTRGNNTSGSMKILSDIQDTLQSLQHLDDDNNNDDGDGEVTINYKGHPQNQSQVANTNANTTSSIIKRPKSCESVIRGDFDVLQVNKRNNRKLDLLRKINGANQIQASNLLSSFDQLDVVVDSSARNSINNYSSRPSTTNSMSSGSRPNSANIKVSNILQHINSTSSNSYTYRNGSDSMRYRYDNIHQSTHDLQDLMRSSSHNNGNNNNYNDHSKLRSQLSLPDDPDFDNYSDYGL